MKKNWSKNSWKNFNATQQPEYRDADSYSKVLKKIESYPPLVFSGEVENLKRQIGMAGDGRRFILQGGDCAERFIDCNESAIINKIKILLQMSVILTYGARKPVVRIGRIAGQYFKPRSNLFETIENNEMHTYRGDSINIYEPGTENREPDPERLLMAFFHSVATLNYIRAIIAGGFADLHHPFSWKLHSIEKTDEWQKYRITAERILDAINFMESFGGLKAETLGKVDFFTSHEGLHLGYEEALTRKDPETGRYYNLGAHMLWIGERTRDIDGAHVEYFRGIHNPIGIKISNKIDPGELIELLHKLNPENEEGRITLIARMGIDSVEENLPILIKKVKESKKKVTWSCDPMHGNIVNIHGNIKKRNFDDIIEEIKQTFRIHSESGSVIGGVHFELTGDDVTECTGGAVNLKDDDLNRNYETYCDPRLNYTQSLEIAFLLSELLS
jgi:3-deoxy-7-phosphoheptulonate synthase